MTDIPPFKPVIVDPETLERLRHNFPAQPEIDAMVPPELCAILRESIQSEKDAWRRVHKAFAAGAECVVITRDGQPIMRLWSDGFMETPHSNQQRLPLMEWPT